MTQTHPDKGIWRDVPKGVRPWVVGAALFLGLSFLLALAQAAQIKANPNVTQALAGPSEMYGRYEQFLADFTITDGQEILMVQADDFADPQVFAQLEDLVFQLQFTDGVEEVLSVFSLPAPGSQTPFLNAGAAQLAQLHREVGYAAQLMDPARTTTILVINTSDISGAGLIDLASLQSRTPDLASSFVGQAEVNRKVAEALLWDQTWLTPISAAICLCMALWILRSWRSALCCAIPPFIGVVWFMGLVSATGTAVDPFLAVLPTMLIALAFADSAHVFYAAQTNVQDQDVFAALVQAVRETAPAAAMTSLTTSIAFLCFLIVGTEAISAFAIWGPVGFACTFLAFCLGFPLAYLVLRPQAVAPRRFGPWLAAAGGALRTPRMAIAAGAVLLLVLLPFAGRAPAAYGLYDYLDPNGHLAGDIAHLTDQGLSSADAYVITRDADGVPGVGEADRARLAQVTQVVLGADAGQAMWSQNSRLIARDGLSYAVPLPWPIGLGSQEMIAAEAALQADLAAAGLAPHTEIIGQSFLAAAMIPQIIMTLRLAFYLSLAAVTVVIAIYLRSIRAALLGTLVSAMPVLAVEALVMLGGAGLTMIAVIALTLAFGIAVDDTIHFLNRYRISRKQGAARLVETLEHVGPPVVATTLILISGLAATAFSALPALPTFALLVCVAVTLALLADLFLLPALLATTQRIEEGQGY